MNIDLGEKIEVHLNNPRRDDREQASGINHKDKKPEIVFIKVHMRMMKEDLHLLSCSFFVVSERLIIEQDLRCQGPILLKIQNYEITL